MATFEFNAFRFYNDDGDEDEATPFAAEDTDITVDAATSDKIVQIRTLVEETAGSDTGDPDDDWNLEYRKNGGSWVVITKTTNNVLANGAATLPNFQTTTNRSTGITAPVGGTFTPGLTRNIAGGSSYFILNVQIGADEFTEFVWALELKSADLINGDTLEFQMDGSFADATLTNTIIPKITIGSAGGPLDLNRLSSMHFMRHYEPISMGE